VLRRSAVACPKADEACSTTLARAHGRFAGVIPKLYPRCSACIRPSDLRKLHDAAQLSWAGWNFQPRDVPPGVTFFVDLVAVSTSESGWNFSLEHMFASHRSLWGFKGTLRFEIVVTADNAEFTSCFVDIEYRQDWHTLSAAEYFPN